MAPRRVLDYAIIILAALGSLYAAARFGLAPRDPDGGVAVIFAPWISQEQALARAARPGGRLVRVGGLPFIVVVTPDAPGYTARVLADGALLVVDPKALAACLTLLSGPASPAS